MTRTELIIQFLKVAIGLAFGAYFVWWSLEVLDRLTPESEAPTPTVETIRLRSAECSEVYIHQKMLAKLLEVERRPDWKARR
jgi:hypothetical protein